MTRKTTTTTTTTKGRRVTEDEREWETCVEEDCDNRVARFVRGDFYCRKHAESTTTPGDVGMIKMHRAYVRDAVAERKRLLGNPKLWTSTTGKALEKMVRQIEESRRELKRLTGSRS